MQSMEGVIMAAYVRQFPTELPPQQIDRSAMLLWHLPVPAPNRPIDAAHEHCRSTNSAPSITTGRTTSIVHRKSMSADRVQCVLTAAESVDGCGLRHRRVGC